MAKGDNSEQLYDARAVQQALEAMAARINKDYAQEREPVLVLAIMKGALVCAGQLLPMLAMALELEYVHATRYRDNKPGRQLHWHYRPQIAMQGRRVLLLDDILDAGITLKAVADFCRTQGAREVRAAVLVYKERREPPVIKADYWALNVPDRYIFGWGMDVDNLARNAPGIYALIQGKDTI